VREDLLGDHIDTLWLLAISGATHVAVLARDQEYVAYKTRGSQLVKSAYRTFAPWEFQGWDECDEMLASAQQIEELLGVENVALVRAFGVMAFALRYSVVKEPNETSLYLDCLARLGILTIAPGSDWYSLGPEGRELIREHVSDYLWMARFFHVLQEMFSGGVYVYRAASA
jgi:hypothetical protein